MLICGRIAETSTKLETNEAEVQKPPEVLLEAPSPTLSPLKPVLKPIAKPPAVLKRSTTLRSLAEVCVSGLVVVGSFQTIVW